MKKPAIFLDRDGTISEEVGYINHLDRFKIMPGSLEAIKEINKSAYLAVVITNQAGVAKGFFRESLVHEVHGYLIKALEAVDAHLDGIYYCPHHPLEGRAPYRRACECRKPKPGLVNRAVLDLDIDLRRSVMVGDNLSDLKLAADLGIPGVLVLTGYGRGVREKIREDQTMAPAHVAENLRDAVSWILRRKG